jgi:broad specificity phosphatase PhoE
MKTISLAFPIYLVRHGETDWNLEGRLQGGRDIPLNDLGRVQAEEAAGRLRHLMLPLDDYDFIASPMSRAIETMEILRGALGFDPKYFQTDERLREITFGSWEGLTWREVKARDPDRARAREQDKWGYVPPDGESYRMLCERIRPAIEALRRESVIVSHGGVARAVLALTGAADRHEATTMDIWQGRILKIVAGRADWI